LLCPCHCSLFSRGPSRPGTEAFLGIGTGTVPHPAGIGSSAVFPIPSRTMREWEFGTFSDISYAIIMYIIAFYLKLYLGSYIECM
jgi:hypothetical protein